MHAEELRLRTALRPIIIAASLNEKATSMKTLLAAAALALLASAAHAGTSTNNYMDGWGYGLLKQWRVAGCIGEPVASEAARLDSAYARLFADTDFQQGVEAADRRFMGQ